MKAGIAYAGLVFVMLLAGCGGGGGAAVTPASAANGSGAAAFAPAAAGSGATGATASSANAGYTYAGCPVFPGTPGGHSGGWYNTDVSHAAPESDSASLVANFTGAGGTSSGFGMIVPPQEVVNTPSSVTLYPIQSTSTAPETSSMPGPAQTYSGSGAPAAGTLWLEGSLGSDGHYNIVQTATCQYWSSGATAWTGSGLNAWNAGLYDLTKPQPLTSNYGSVADCCGVPMVAFMIKPAELKAGVINHALGWISPGNEGSASPVDPNRFVSPAVEAQGGQACSTPAPCMPYGAHIRLKSSFNDAGFSPGARAVAEALKRYGAYLMDTGCCLQIAYLAQDWSGIDINAYWSSSDGSYLSTIGMKDMDVINPSDSNAPN